MLTGYAPQLSPPLNRAVGFLPRGFTTIELMISVFVAGLLAALMLPGFQAQLRKTRRSDALLAIAQVQQAQERWRGMQPVYAASLATLSLSSRSPAGHYAIATTTDAATAAQGYIVTAVGTGNQAQDALCLHLRVVVNGGSLRHQSGPDSRYGNDDEANRACWAL